MTATLPRPGTIVTVRTAPPPRTQPMDTGTWFVTGFADRGPIAPVLVQSLQDFINNFGQRQTYSPLYDAMETFFREGGRQAYVSRVVGPASAVATVNLLDGGAAISLVATAKGPGAYANSRRIAVQVPGNGGTAASFSLLITDTGDPTVSEQSPDFLTQAAAVSWAKLSTTINLALGASALIPVAIGAAALATGTDDRVNAVDLHWRNAQALFTRDLGPGQVTQVGRTTTTAHTDTLAHALANNRTAILDAPDSPTVATVTAAAASQRGGPAENYGGMFAPWLTVPGVLPGQTRNVPPSALVCAKIAVSDATSNNPNQPAAAFPSASSTGGVANWVTGLNQPTYDNGTGPDVTRDSMYAAGVNQIIIKYNQVVVYGWRSLVDSNGANQDWVNLAGCRLRMAVVNKTTILMDNYVLDQIDGLGALFKTIQGDIVGQVLLPYYRLSALYGLTPEQAFTVDTGPTVNTPTTIQNREVHAAIGLRTSPDAELVVVEIAKVPSNVSL